MNIAEWAALGAAAAILVAPTMVSADSYWEVEAEMSHFRLRAAR
jgi:hypothetical protein